MKHQKFDWVGERERVQRIKNQQTITTFDTLLEGAKKIFSVYLSSRGENFQKF
jgi:hypothetical protein